MVGVVFGGLPDVKKVWETFPEAVFGFGPFDGPICFSEKGKTVNFGGGMVAVYRARKQLPRIYVIDDEGDIIGEKGARLRVVPEEELLSKIDEGQSRDDLTELIEAARKNWPISSLLVKNYSLYLKIDVNDSSKLDLEGLTPLMTDFFYRLTIEMINSGIYVGETTGESISCYPERIEQIKRIKEWLAMNQCQYPWSLKAAIVGPGIERFFYQAPSGVCPFVWPQTPLEIIEETEIAAKKKRGLAYRAQPL